MYRQEIIHDIHLFTSQPKARFYDVLLQHVDTSVIAKTAARTGRKSQREALFCSFIVMKCEGFSQITDLVDYLNNNLLIAYYCGFDITKPLPSYWTFDRFIRKTDSQILKDIMQEQVSRLVKQGVIDTSFIGLDSTCVFANTHRNNPKSFGAEGRAMADKDCEAGVYTTPSKHSMKGSTFYWGYKSHVLCDLISGLPIYEMTTTAARQDSTVAIEILSSTNTFLPLTGCTFVADKGYDVKSIYNTVRDVYGGDCVIPLKKQSEESKARFAAGSVICEAELVMHKNGTYDDGYRTLSRFCFPLRRSKKKSCPIDHKNWNNGKKHRGCSKNVTVPDDYRLSIDRTSVEFKSVYALRTECERYNSRFKSTGQARLWVRNAESAANLNSVAHIALLAIALAVVISKSQVSHRCLKSAKRVA